MFGDTIELNCWYPDNRNHPQRPTSKQVHMYLSYLLSLLPYLSMVGWKGVRSTFEPLLRRVLKSLSLRLLPGIVDPKPIWERRECAYHACLLCFHQSGYVVDLVPLPFWEPPSCPQRSILSFICIPQLLPLMCQHWAFSRCPYAHLWVLLCPLSILRDMSQVLGSLESSCPRDESPGENSIKWCQVTQ